MRLEHILPQGGSAFVGMCSEMEGCTPCHCSSGIHISPKKAFNRVCPPPLGDISSGWDNSVATSDSLPPAILSFHPLHQAPCAVFQLHNRVHFLTLYSTAQCQHLMQDRMHSDSFPQRWGAQDST